MDFLYGHDRKLGYLEDDSEMVDFLDTNDIFNTPMIDGIPGGSGFDDWQFEAKTSSFPTPDEEPYENDWLNSFLDDPVLNDRMMTDAMQPPCIKSEHSYSISEGGPSSPLLHTQEDMDGDLFPSQAALDLSMKSVATSPELKVEVTNPESFLAQPVSSMSSSSLSTSTSSSLAPSPFTSMAPPPISISPRQPPTIIVTTTSAAAAAASAQTTTTFFQNETLTFPTIHIKQEPSDMMEHSHEQTVNLDTLVYNPLTPPGSSGSDSDGSASPQHSTPGSPIRHTMRHDPALSPSLSKPYAQPLFVNPISQSGVLILSEEEKRTLISEGYPVPSKLPLTKQEEKNLKKIRRKIKNKISAQESRRKKKEYLEALEKRVEAYNHENNDLKKKVENLENNNRSLMGQLQKLQSLVTKMPKAASATQTSTALMVFVFCFAVYLGSGLPSNLNISYSSPAHQAHQPTDGLAHHHHYAEDIGPHPAPRGGPHVIGPHMHKPGDNRPPVDDASDPYATPNLKSRMLMSVESEDSCEDFVSMPWTVAMSCPLPDNEAPASGNRVAPGVDLFGAGEISEGSVELTSDLTLVEMEATVFMVVTAGPGMDNNSDSKAHESGHYQRVASMPDITTSGDDMVKPNAGLRETVVADAESMA